jgi:nucleoside-diphosphate-sugar epimerase
MNILLIGPGYVGSALIKALSHHHITSTNLRERPESLFKDQNLIIVTPKTPVHTPLPLIAISSTACYGDASGAFVKENEAPPTEYEQEVLLNPKACIFRLSEIYGPGREISLRFKTKTHFPGSPNNPTNMIHLDDIVGAILFAIEHHLTGIYNLTDDDHMTRNELYSHYQKVTFDPSIKPRFGGNRCVSNAKIKEAGYVLKYPHRILN